MEKRRSTVVADIPPTIPGICYILLFPLSKNLKDFTFLPFSYCSYCFVPTSCQASLMSRRLLCNIIFCNHSTCSLCNPLQKQHLPYCNIFLVLSVVLLSQCLRQLQAQLHYHKGSQRGQMQTALYLVAFPRKKPAGRTLPPPKRQRSSLMQAEKKRTDKLLLTL